VRDRATSPDNDEQQWPTKTANGHRDARLPPLERLAPANGGRIRAFTLFLAFDEVVQIAPPAGDKEQS
jgi:hypothetical protein